MATLGAHSVLAEHVAAGIPYRSGYAVPPESLVSAVLITLIVLGLVVGGLLIARRRGWLRPWTGRSRTTKQGDAGWKVAARVRLSATTRAYVLENEHASFLVFESSQHLAVKAIDRSERDGDVGAE